jgi:hypothetical protein
MPGTSRICLSPGATSTSASEQKPAEVYAVELCEAECGAGCAVVTRDYDAVKAAEKCAVLIFRGGRFWRASEA